MIKSDKDCLEQYEWVIVERYDKKKIRGTRIAAFIDPAEAKIACKALNACSDRTQKHVVRHVRRAK